MPLIDSGESLADEELTGRFREYFSMTSNGLIRDSNNQNWMIWSISEIERWWGIFETNLAVPFGRKLFNSCCDEEEFQIYSEQIMKSGWFKKSGNRKRLNHRWDIFGWGIIDIESKKVSTNLPSSIAAGLAVAGFESFNDMRYKSEWKQINQTEILLELKPDHNQLPLAKKHTQLPWLGNNVIMANKAVLHQLELRDLGWSVEGEPMVILPASIFSRLFYSTMGTKSSLGIEIIDSWNVSGLEEKFVKPLIFASYSTYQLFLNSDKHVFAESEDSWANIISHYCGQWGWGDVINLTVDKNSNSIKLNCEVNELLPFFIGQVMGIWERSHGRKPRVSLLFIGDNVEISIESLLEYI
jgi:hypothetical protein